MRIQIESGDPAAADQLLPLVYDELRKLAAAKLAKEKPGPTLQATALVHEAFLRLVGGLGEHAPARDWEFRACRSHLNKALWFYLNFPDLFEQAALYARADLLATSRFAIRRHDLPRAPIRVTPAMTTALAKALREFYWPSQMRGNHCHVEHHSRVGGGEYFFAYLDDWPDMRLAFEDDGRLETHSARFAFSVLFIYNPMEGSLDKSQPWGKVELSLTTTPFSPRSSKPTPWFSVRLHGFDGVTEFLVVQHGQFKITAGKRRVLIEELPVSHGGGGEIVAFAGLPCSLVGGAEFGGDVGPFAAREKNCQHGSVDEFSPVHVVQSTVSPAPPQDHSLIRRQAFLAPLLTSAT